MVKIHTSRIQEAIYNLCVQANTVYEQSLYNVVYYKYLNESNSHRRDVLKNILLNADLANKKKRPLCQDTGQVVIFIEIGQQVTIVGESLNDAINTAVEKAYTANFFRKSVVKNSIFDRTNTNTNTPALIFTNVVDGDSINIKLLVKGAGSENCSNIKMFTPAATEEDVFKFIKDTIISAGEKSCPPLVVGIGIGGTMESAAIMSKQAFFNQEPSCDEVAFLSRLQNFLGEINDSVLDFKIMTSSTHIACLPVAITLNCHSCRHSNCRITQDCIRYGNKELLAKNIEISSSNYKLINSSNIESIRLLKKGEQILLTGEIITARDAAHKKLYELYVQNKSLPFELKDKIIFYAGPCPAAQDEIIGPIGPTTASRMDVYLDFVHSQGCIATIGKGERSASAVDIITKHNAKYFTAQGGVACLLANCVKYSEIIAFDELGTESIRKLYVEDFPLTVDT